MQIIICPCPLGALRVLLALCVNVLSQHSIDTKGKICKLLQVFSCLKRSLLRKAALGAGKEVERE